MSNRAWVTLATNDSYGLGALVLAHSLRRAGSAYPAVVLITPSVTEAMSNRLRAVYADVVTVDVLDSRDATHLALLQRPELGITFTKIHCWSLTQYEKCVFLDADTLVVQNSDELFEREELSAAPDVGWPDCFNSGVFVFQPSADTFNALIKFAQERGSFDGGDQGLLNSFFSDWAYGDINKHLPFLYNVTSAAFYSYLPALKHYGQNLKIIHFIGAVKPWLQQYNWESRTVGAPDHLRELLQLWWDIFVSQVHCQLDTTMSGVAGNLARVVPGSGFQREALDELTRRQGWEAGNIDYMGADSFDNIWAKISQTLSQPRSSPAKQSPPKELAPPQPVVQPVEVAKEVVPGEAPVIEAPAVVDAPVPVESAVPIETPASVEEPLSVAATADETATAPEVPIEAPVQSEIPAPIPTPDVVPAEIPACGEETVTTEIPTPVEASEKVEAVVESSPQAPETPSETKVETESVEPPQVPISDTPSAEEIPNEVVPASPVVEVKQVAQVTKAAPSSPAPPTDVPASPAVPEQKATPEKPAVATAATDSPPLANTPSKEEAPAVPAAKSVERRKPAGKLQLSPPAAADPLPTPDSELEDAASLAQSIIASELRTPTVTAPEPAAATPAPVLASPAPPAPAPALAQEKRLTVEEPEVPTPPVGAVSLAQIGVKPIPKGKASTAALIESSVLPQSPTESSAPAAPAEVPKKKVVKKVVKKEGATSGEAPVPPPRKKEKKPKEK